LALNPINAAVHQRAAEHSCAIVWQTTLNAMEVLADAAICIESHALEQTLTARQSLKQIKFRRPVAPIAANAQPQRQSCATQPDAAEQQNDLVTQNNNDAVKRRLLDLIKHSHYHFNPSDYTENRARLKQNWTLCYYQGTTPAPQTMPTQVNIEYERPGDNTSPCYADFWQNGYDGEDGQLALIANRLTFSADHAMSSRARPLQPLPKETQSLPQIFSEGVSILHLCDEALVIQANNGQILGFANLD
ncbi:MAG: hypothetical protein ACRC9T_02330, partial [Vibrionaceae bacterium]